LSRKFTNTTTTTPYGGDTTTSTTATTTYLIKFENKKREIKIFITRLIYIKD